MISLNRATFVLFNIFFFLNRFIKSFGTSNWPS